MCSTPVFIYGGCVGWFLFKFMEDRDVFGHHFSTKEGTLIIGINWYHLTQKAANLSLDGKHCTKCQLRNVLQAL